MKSVPQNVSQSTRKRNPDLYGTNQINSVAPTEERQPNPSHESLGPATGEGGDSNRCLVRITSFRVRLIDERNLWDKYFVDSLVKAGLLRDDSPQWCKVEVQQQKVSVPELEQTVIEISNL